MCKPISYMYKIIYKVSARVLFWITCTFDWKNNDFPRHCPRRHYHCQRARASNVIINRR